METKRVARRKHSAELRAEVVQACRQDGASVAAIALRSGLNANLVHRWLREDGRSLDTDADSPGAQFMALQLHAPPVAGMSTDIRVEVRRGTSIITVSWPLQGARDCAAWLREWLR
jgi:transposase-like protein